MRFFPLTFLLACENVDLSGLTWSASAPEDSGGGAATATGCIPGARDNPCCETDEQCSDALYCNGIEVCDPGSAYADDFGCAAQAGPCDAPLTCDETADVCYCNEVDDDGDGFASMTEGDCPGTDCDDADSGRHPAAPEVCDSDGVDEDCDPATLGVRDSDRDGYQSNTCCNEGVCELDCDDENPAILPGAQVCGANPDDVLLCDGGAWWATSCDAGYTCANQPNGTGVCVPATP